MNLYTEPNTSRIYFNQKIEKKQHKLLALSLIYASIGFIVIAGLSMLVSWLLNKYAYTFFYTSGYYITSSVIIIVCMFISMFMNLKWNFNPINASIGTIIANYVIYAILYTAMLSPLIALINDYWTIFLAIGILALIMLATGLVGYCLINAKIAFTISKMIYILLPILFIFNLIFILVFSFTYANMQIWEIIYFSLFGLLSIGMLILSFYNISKTSLFCNDFDNVSINKLGAYFGFGILSIMLSLFYIILRFLIMLKNN